jgi:hypothetical protein
MPKHIRGKRARARQRSRYDFRDRYRQSDIPVENIGIIRIEDPYSEAGHVDAAGNLVLTARLEPYRHADGTASPGELGWTAPRKQRITVIRRLDALARLHHRRQIDDVQYEAAKTFQRAIDQATLGAMHTVDWARTKVSGGIPRDPLSEAQKRAMRLVRHAELQLMRRHGSDGLAITRCVLAEGQSVEQAARLRGAASRRDMQVWTRLFRCCLDTLAAIFGFSNSTRQPYRAKWVDGENPAEDSGRQADTADLMNPQFRSGRANGRG